MMRIVLCKKNVKVCVHQSLDMYRLFLLTIQHEVDTGIEKLSNPQL